LTVQETPVFVSNGGNQFLVVYTFTPINGQWGALDTGSWTVDVVNNQVGDFTQHVTAGIVDTFTVKSMLVVGFQMSILQTNFYSWSLLQQQRLY
jgi:hypothetical protein